MHRVQLVFFVFFWGGCLYQWRTPCDSYTWLDFHTTRHTNEWRRKPSTDFLFFFVFFYENRTWARRYFSKLKRHPGVLGREGGVLRVRQRVHRGPVCSLCVCLLFPTAGPLWGKRQCQTRVELDLQALNNLEDQGSLEGTQVQQFVHTVAFASFHLGENYYERFW